MGRRWREHSLATRGETVSFSAVSDAQRMAVSLAIKAVPTNSSGQLARLVAEDVWSKSAT